MTLRAKLIAGWGILGILALFGSAVVRLTPPALEPLLKHELSALHVALYGLSVLLMGYSEGYRAFQLRFSPRVVQRAMELGSGPTSPLQVLLATPICMGLLWAPKRRLLSSWLLLVGIVLLVVLVRQMSQPWRGIVDAGVVVGLSWGIVSTVVCFGRELGGRCCPEGPVVSA